MRYAKTLAYWLTTLVLVLGAGTAAGQTGDNVLVQGAPYSNTNGINFDDSGRLHVASVLAGMILILDPESGSPLGMLGADEGVRSPDDLIFGPDGSLYWTNILQGEVGRRTPDGITTTQLVAPGVNPITFSDDGRLFVACDFYGDGLYELDPELEDPPRLLIETLGWLNGFDFGPDGLLYGPIISEDRVVRIDVDAVPPTVETVFDGHHVGAVKFDSQGRLAATDLGSGEVLRADVGTGEVEVIAQLTPGLDNLAFDATDRLFVSSHVEGFIVEVLADGSARTVVPGGLVMPGGVAVMPDAEGDVVFVGDISSVREIDGATGQQLGLVMAGFAPGELQYPNSVAPYGDDLVVTNWFSNQVQILDWRQGVVSEQYLDFVLPTNAITFGEDLVIAELGQDGLAPRVVRVGDAGTENLMDSSQGLYYPTGLAATDDDLWVADWAGGVIWQLISGGETLAEPIPVTAGLLAPEGLAVDAAGHLLVVETGTAGAGPIVLGRRLTRVDPQTGVSSILVGGLDVGLPGPEGMPPHFMLSGVAIGASGSAYVTGDLSRVLYRFDLETFYIPAAAHKAGAAGTQWITDLTIHNRADTAAAYSIDLLPKRQDNSAPVTRSFSLEPSSSVGYDDALDELFRFAGAAALRVRSTSGDLLVGSRTYNDQPEGTYGQFIAGFPEDEALVSGDMGLLIGLSHGADDRTNVGFASACSAPISVNVTLYAADGAQIGQRTVELAPYSYDQVTDIFGDYSSGDVEHGFAVVASSSPGARFFAYASVIDNRTGDAVYIPAR